MVRKRSLYLLSDKFRGWNPYCWVNWLSTNSNNGSISCPKTQNGSINLCVSPKTEASFKPYKNVSLTLVLLYTSLASLSFGKRSIICPMADWKHKLSFAAKLSFQWHIEKPVTLPPYDNYQIQPIIISFIWSFLATLFFGLLAFGWTQIGRKGSNW